MLSMWGTEGFSSPPPKNLVSPVFWLHRSSLALQLSEMEYVLLLYIHNNQSLESKSGNSMPPILLDLLLPLSLLNTISEEFAHPMITQNNLLSPSLVS